MRYTGEICPICQQAFTEDDDVVVCPLCGTPHHRDCYTAHGACANADAHGSGFNWAPNENGAPATPVTPDAPPIAAPNAALPQPPKADGHNIVFCTQCGKENNAQDKVCKFCGAPLQAPNAAAQPPTMTLPNGEQLYGPQPILVRPEDDLDGVPFGDVAEYVQLGARKYMPKFYMMSKTHKKVSWNWAAFFFTPFWFFYRKLYGLGAILLTVLVLVTGFCSTPRLMEAEQAFLDTALEVQAEDSTLSLEEADAALKASYLAVLRCPELYIATLTQFGVALFSGLFANFYYKKKAIAEVKRLKAQNLEQEQYRLLLFRRGGVAVFMCILSYWILQLATQLIAVAISHFMG